MFLMYSLLEYLGRKKSIKNTICLNEYPDKIGGTCNAPIKYHIIAWKGCHLLWSDFLRSSGGHYRIIQSSLLIKYRLQMGQYYNHIIIVKCKKIYALMYQSMHFLKSVIYIPSTLTSSLQSTENRPQWTH